MSKVVFQTHVVNIENLSLYNIALENILKDSESQLKVRCATGSLDIPIQWIQSFSPFIRELLLTAKESFSFSLSKADPVVLILPHFKVEIFRNLVEILVYGQVQTVGDHETIEKELLELAQVLQIPVEGLVIESSNKRLRIRNIQELLDTSDRSLPPSQISNDNGDSIEQTFGNYSDQHSDLCGISDVSELSLSRTIDDDDSQNEGSLSIINYNNNNIIAEANKCSFCGICFSNSAQAKAHITKSDIANFCYDGESRTDLRLYLICPFNGCRSRFNSPIYLYRHQQDKHKNIMWPFKCKSCQNVGVHYTTRCPYSLVQHERNRHQHDIHIILKTDHDNEVTFSYVTSEAKKP